MKRFIVLLTISGLYSQITGLSGWNIFIDQGHSQKENMGVNGYSEAEEVLRVGLHLQDILLNQTDIDTAYVSRKMTNSRYRSISALTMQILLERPGTIPSTVMPGLRNTIIHYCCGVSCLMDNRTLQSAVRK